MQLHKCHKTFPTALCPVRDSHVMPASISVTFQADIITRTAALMSRTSDICMCSLEGTSTEGDILKRSLFKARGWRVGWCWRNVQAMGQEPVEGHSWQGLGLLRTEQTLRQEGLPDVSKRPTASFFKGQAV